MRQTIKYIQIKHKESNANLIQQSIHLWIGCAKMRVCVCVFEKDKERPNKGYIEK